MDNLQAEEDSQTRHISVINEMRALELERYKEKLQEELAATNLTEQEKLRAAAGICSGDAGAAGSTGDRSESFVGQCPGIHQK